VPLILFKNCDKIIKRMLEVKMNDNTSTLITQGFQLLRKLPDDHELKDIFRQIITITQFINNNVNYLKEQNKEYGTQHWGKITSLEKENSELRKEIELLKEELRKEIIPLKEQYSEYKKIKTTVYRTIYSVLTSSAVLGGIGAFIYEKLIK
jgi:predicted nuclease with TOPRIM domain